MSPFDAANRARVYLTRGDSALASVNLLTDTGLMSEAELNVHRHSVAMLAVRGAIAYSDAVLASFGENPANDSHDEAPRRLRRQTGGRNAVGVRHFEYLLGKKNLYEYQPRRLDISEARNAADRLRRFFAWIYTTCKSELPVNPAEEGEDGHS